MSQKYQKLIALLKELFQLDQPDLDFGLYRIMHAKSAEVSQFLDKDLLPQVKAAFGEYKSADRSQIEADLKRAIEQAEGLGVSPESTQKVKDLRARLANDAVDVDALEGEVYDHLYSFFRRYYSEGDFLSKRVYKPGVYAIPYEGEEVKLHWANADQYYIKTSEYLRDYAFRLRPDDEAQPMRVHFRLVDAAEGEHGNVKAIEGKDRRFKLAVAESLVVEAGELIVRFTYQPDPAKQKDLNAATEQYILRSTDSALSAWVEALRAQHRRADGSESECTRLRVHIDRYTGRNTFDYFIHKDLRGFLRRELDFYIKNEVMHLDDIEDESAPRVEQYLSKIKIIRRIAGKIIDFLAQLEDFQKKLWLKRKFVVETSWCIRASCIPSEYYPEIAKNEAQRQEWIGQLAAKVVRSDSKAREGCEEDWAALICDQPALIVDTKHFADTFTSRLLETIGDLEGQTDGVLIQGDNFHALSLLAAKHQGEVQFTYIDPPYNTGEDGFIYRDAYRHSSWISMLGNRLANGRQLEARLGTIAISIDDEELDRLCQLIREVYGDAEVAKLVWDRNRKNDARHFSVGHEYMVIAARDKRALSESNKAFREPKEGIGEARELYSRLRMEYLDDWDEVRVAWRKWFDSIPQSDPRRRLMRYSKVGPRGPYRDDGNINWPGGGGPRYEVLHPVTKKPCRLPISGWRYPTAERFWEEHSQGRIAFGPDHRTVPSVIYYLFDSDGQVMPSVHYSYAQTAAQEFDALFGKRVFDNPKNWRDIERLVRYMAGPKSIILDYFSGSGTTGHAVIMLNREDAGGRKCILVEMGEHFDTVLLPRLKKVIFSPEWKDGKPLRLATAEEAERSPRILKVLRLESYEDALNNLEVARSEPQKKLLFSPEAQGADGLKEQYVLRYMLDVETRGSASLLNVQAFVDPAAYKLKVKRPGSDESREVNVDLLETFNWLIGLTVKHLAAPRTFRAAFERDEEGRLRLKGLLRQDPAGPFWFRTVSGTTPGGRRTLVVWRKLTGVPEEDNLVLDEWFTKQGYSSKDSEFDLIYVNGGNNLENLKTPDDLWKVRLIEEDFHRLMFETEGS